MSTFEDGPFIFYILVGRVNDVNLVTITCWPQRHLPYAHYKRVEIPLNHCIYNHPSAYHHQIPRTGLPSQKLPSRTAQTRSQAPKSIAYHPCNLILSLCRIVYSMTINILGSLAMMWKRAFGFTVKTTLCLHGLTGLRPIMLANCLSLIGSSSCSPTGARLLIKATCGCQSS
ncbi:hypothetical protein LY76DRAFT_298716 [Colletotrichum caudatum]|nr:hypothetical protein LY76DRAFT_298716 [Colletotrichum caudatum]